MQDSIHEADEALLWERYAERADADARAALIELHGELVRKVAATLYKRRFDDSVEFDEYCQFGTVGLIEAVDRYRRDKGVAFETFASYRIRGAILNGLQKMTERHDQNAFRARMRKERLEALVEAESDKTNLFEEMVELTLGLAIGFMLEDTGLVRDESSAAEDRAYRSSELAQVKRQLRDALESLPERERLILQYHYFQQTTFDNLAEILDLTKGRVSQLHKRALSLLRERLASKSLDDYF